MFDLVGYIIERFPYPWVLAARAATSACCLFHCSMLSVAFFSDRFRRLFSLAGCAALEVLGDVDDEVDVSVDVEEDDSPPWASLAFLAFLALSLAFLARSLLRRRSSRRCCRRCAFLARFFVSPSGCLLPPRRPAGVGLVKACAKMAA